MRHGHHANGKPSPTYVTWQHMKARCNDKRHHAYDSYGGRGVNVCDRWTSFDDFLADMGERPAGMSLDRIDNSKGYEPGNCRWATAKEQASNRRHPKPIKLSLDDRAAIRSLLETGLTGKYVAGLYGVTAARISQVKYGR